MDRNLIDIGLILALNVRGCSELFRGIAQYTSQKPDWRLHRLNPAWARFDHETFRLRSEMRAYLGHVDCHQDLNALLGMSCPVVCTSDKYLIRPQPQLADRDWSFVALDRSHLTLRMIDYALSHGAGTLAFVFSQGNLFTADVYRDHVERAGAHFQTFAFPPQQPIEPSAILPFLRALPKGSMLLVFDESAAEFILELLRFEGIEVPDQLGLITVSPDGLCCDTVRPSLTYLRLPFFRIGYEAARLLDERLSHPGTPPVVRRIGVDYIAERQSTSLRLSGDPIVDDILRRIAHHAHRPTSVGEILKGVSLKRRATEMRFAAVTGLTLRAAIERERLRAACELLETTDLPIVDVAARTGFSGPSLFCKAFRKAHGRTPAVFRSLLRNMNRLAQAEESEPSTPLRRRVRARR